MKKIIISLFIVMILILINSNNEEYIVIPDNAIRFRIIANSNNIEDQQTKYRIKNEITPVLMNIEDNVTNYHTSQNIIEESIPSIKTILDNNNLEYSIKYGENFFPEKVYQGVKYPEGNYESLVITLGDGLGDNWWCVLFPPLCLLEDVDTNDVSYSLFIKEIIDKYYK